MHEAAVSFEEATPQAQGLAFHWWLDLLLQFCSASEFT
jgi:hypothetical protein